MAEKEMQAHDMVRRRNWSRAVSLYDQLLAAGANASNNSNSQNSANTPAAAAANSNANPPAGGIVVLARSHKDRQIACLLGRCECLLELNRYEQCLADARKVLALLSDQSGECLASVSRARRWLVHALCKLKKYTEAEQLLREWIGELNGQQSFLDISKTLERYKSIIQMINGHKSTQKISQSRLEDEMSILDTKLDHWATNNLPLDKYSKLLSNKGLKKREGGGGGGASIQQNGSVGSGGGNSSASSNGGGGSSISSSSSSGSGISVSALHKTTDLLAAIKVAGGKNAVNDDGDTATYCSYCAINFESRNELRQHCQTERHQNVIMSYEGRDWKWRPPPRGFTLDSYSLCEAYQEPQTCHYGNQCVEAHGLDELNEWKERFEYRRMRLQKASEKELYGKSYTEQILEQWIQATAPERVMCEKVESVDVKCEQELVTSISSKSSKREWVFMLKAPTPLKAVALLQDAHRNHFAIKMIKLDSGATTQAPRVELKSDQEWVAGRAVDKQELKGKSEENATTTAATDVGSLTALLEHQVTIEFHTEIYGTFRQAVCFDFGTQPLLVKHLCVDVVPVGDAEKIEEIKRDIINSSVTRWDASTANLVKFETTIGTHLKTEAYLNDIKHEKEMLDRYPCPRAQTFTLTQSTIVEKRLTQNNYRSRIHELLYVEEIARYEQIARYNVRTKLTVTSNYILTPAGMATSTAKYSLAGELFALMRLGKDISEDTSAGRLILSNCSSVYISAPEELTLRDKKRSVYEATIEDKGKNVIYLKLSAKCVDGMTLKADTEIEVDIQFQLNRLPYCEWHNAVDKITDFKIIFPATEVEPNIPWTPKKQWSDACEPKLNAKQREAVNAITTSLGIKLPPILLIGPFGTGKTYTLAQAIKQLLTQPEAKILICTHSNSAADLYIKEYLHPWIEEGVEEATPLRVYYHKRWVATVNSVVQKYCITDGAGNFRRPTVDDIKKHRIVVVTLSISMELASLGLPKGYFTHIFLDEAAQAMECEAIMPLALANDSTRIVLAGDHMQMSPELFSAFAKERKLHISLLERLYDHYPSNFPCKILLCENYRAHEAIIKFTSELFYEQKLIASGKQPRHERFYPLTFFTTRGEDVQDKNSTAFYNNAEVYEVVERVSELRKKWPSSWGKMNDASIGIMTPYADQVFRIRSELRKRRMGGISVERVLNVQGKQFRAVFLSTVRTRRTCLPLTMIGAPPGAPGGNSMNSPEDADYGFLSNSKLLNTAITRAQSLVAVVGDPVALCSIGRCRKVWERFIEICDENKSLFGITWSFLRSQLDGVELKRGYVLNPLAPEFIPRSLQPEAYLRDQAAMYLLGAGAANNHHPGPHGGGPHHNAGGPMGAHAGMLAAAGAGGGGGGQMPPHHAAAMAGSQQMPHMYAPHSSAAAAAAYNAGGAAAMMNMAGKGGGHHFSGHPNHMNMRAMGPHQPGGPQQPPPPPLGQQYNMRGLPPPPAVHLNQPPAVAGQFGPYMPWQQTPQQQLRGGPPGSGGGGYMVVAAQQQGPPQSQNPNASLWGPPPQSNPWSVLPKQAMPPQPPNSVAGNVRQMGPPPPPQQQQQTPAGMRGGSVPLQPSNAQQMRPANSNELGYLAKKAYGQHQPPPAQPPPPHGNFAGYASGNQPPPPNQLQLLNQRNQMGSIPNGPISPMDPFMARTQGGQPTAQPSQNSFFGNAGGSGAGNNSMVGGGLKEKDFQFLNNVPPLNIGGSGNMFQPPPPPSLQPPPAGNKQQSPTAPRFPQPQEYAALLPPNMSIYEMAFEPKELQYKWCLKLLETHGQEAANKFTDGLGQVIAMVQQQQHQQPGKPVPPLQPPPPPHLNVNPMLPRELMQQGMLPLMGGNSLGHQQQSAAQQQRNSMGGGMHPSFMNPMASMANAMNAAAAVGQQAPSLLPPPTDETPPIDSINFNQQIDLAFTTLLNGNNTQPILRDLFNSGGTSAVGSGGLMNGDLLLSASTASIASTSASNVSSEPQLLKMFPVVSSAGGGLQQPLNMPKGPPPPHLFPMQSMQQHMQAPPSQQQPNAGAFLGGSTLLNSKDLLLGSSSNSASSASVPLYRRQAMTTPMGNGHGNSIGGGTAMSNNNSSNYGVNVTTPTSMSGGSGYMLGASTAPDNILTGGTTDILAGLGTNASNLIEALFQSNTSANGAALEQQHAPPPHQHQQQQQAQQQQPGSNSGFQKMFNHYDSYNAGLKKYDMEMLIREQHGAAGAGGSGGGGDVTNNHHGPAPSHYHNSANTSQPNAVSAADNRNTTYAAVLSQGQHHHHQQQQQQQQQQQHHHQQQQQQHQQAIGIHHNNYHAEPPSAGNAGGSGEVEKDLFAAIRELGQGTNGFYNYFQ